MVRDEISHFSGYCNCLVRTEQTSSRKQNSNPWGIPSRTRSMLYFLRVIHQVEFKML